MNHKPHLSLKYQNLSVSVNVSKVRVPVVVTPQDQHLDLAIVCISTSLLQLCHKQTPSNLLVTTGYGQIGHLVALPVRIM